MNMAEHKTIKTNCYCMHKINQGLPSHPNKNLYITANSESCTNMLYHLLLRSCRITFLTGIYNIYINPNHFYTGGNLIYFTF